MSEEKKVLLSINNLEVKFNVRGRQLTAIRDVSFDIYENESIAIVGESGSGKSVLTKTFTGMLESNGIITKGNIIYQDDQLSALKIKLSRFDVIRYNKLVEFLNRNAKYIGGKDIYLKMQKLKNEFEQSKRLTDEELETYKRKIDDLNYQRTEYYNKKIVAPNKSKKQQYEEDIKNLQVQINGLNKKLLQAENKEEIETEIASLNAQIEELNRKIETASTENERKRYAQAIKALDNQIKEIKKEEKQARKARCLSVKQNKEAILEYKQTMANLNKDYIKAVDNYVVSENVLKRNKELAKEIILSINRYSILTQFFYLHSLKDRFENAFRNNLEFNDKTLEKLYELITFRVLYKGVENEYFNPLDEKEAKELEKTNEKTLKDAKKGVYYSKIVNYAKQINANEKFVQYVIKVLLESNRYSDLDKLLEETSEKLIISPNSILKGYTILDLTKIKTASEWQKIRGSRIAMVFQDPMTSLNPIVTIGKQITEVIIKHQDCSMAEAEKRAIELMDKVGIPDAAKRFKEYPFQYSGGMRQRIVIAIALACQPKVLICDEPTTALDVTIQAQIIELIKKLQKEFQFTTIYITHDLGVVASVADRVAVLYAGQIVEAGLVHEIFYDPRHPYTWALLSSLPQLAIKGQELFSIQGTPPSLYNKIKGDAFAERNPYCLAVDLEYEPPRFYVSDTHFAKTWLLDPRAPKISKPSLIENIHEKLELAQTKLNKEEYAYVRHNKERSNLVTTQYRHRISKR